MALCPATGAVALQPELRYNALAMFSLPFFIQDTLAKLNRAAMWRREVRVWDQPLFVPTADRLLYAALHRVGWMGRAEHRFFPGVIRPGMTVIDVGANIGLYALFFAQLVGPAGAVYGFEPDPDLYGALARARQLASRENLHAFPLALGDRAGKQRLQRSFFNSGDNRLHGSAGSGIEIDVTIGDEVLAGVPTVDFIKIDVQGWELRALRGLNATIDRSPNIQIYLEFWPAGLRAAGCEPADLLNFLSGHGLAIRRRRAGHWEAADSWATLEKEAPGHRYINLWAGKLLS
jgi:FkbM family methyltransferase